MTVEFETIITEMCGMYNEWCKPLEEPKNSEILEKMDVLFDTDYTGSCFTSFVLNDCYAADGGICVISERNNGIRLDLFSNDGYRNDIGAHPQSFRNIIGSYINNEVIHEDVLRAIPASQSSLNASNVAFLKGIIGEEDEGEYGLSYLLVLALNWMIYSLDL